MGTETTEASTTPEEYTSASTTVFRQIPNKWKKIPRIEMVADMPVLEDDIPDDYDYSHFDYLNERFEKDSRETAMEIDYYSEEYIYVSEKSTIDRQTQEYTKTFLDSSHILIEEE